MEMESNVTVIVSYETLRKVSKINLGKSYEDKPKKCKQKQRAKYYV